MQDLQDSLKADFVPIAKYQEKEIRLNELTQAVTERTNLIRELRADLDSIQSEEQVFIKMCLADAKCKAAMSERLGFD